MNAFGTSVSFAPLIPWAALWIFAGIGLALVVAINRRRQGATADDISVLRG